MNGHHDPRGSRPHHGASRTATTARRDATDDGTAGVVDLVATVEGVGPTDLDPLQWTIDTDLVDHVAAADGAGADVELSFAYHGYRVTVAGTGRVTVAREPEPRPEPAVRPGSSPSVPADESPTVDPHPDATRADGG